MTVAAPDLDPMLSGAMPPEWMHPQDAGPLDPEKALARLCHNVYVCRERCENSVPSLRSGDERQLDSLRLAIPRLMEAGRHLRWYQPYFSACTGFRKVAGSGVAPAEHACCLVGQMARIHDELLPVWEVYRYYPLWTGNWGGGGVDYNVLYSVGLGRRRSVDHFSGTCWRMPPSDDERQCSWEMFGTQLVPIGLNGW